MNYYLSRNYRDTNSAGNKAKTDIEDIMADMGFRNAPQFPSRQRKSIPRHIGKRVENAYEPPPGRHSGNSVSP